MSSKNRQSQFDRPLKKAKGRNRPESAKSPTSESIDPEEREDDIVIFRGYVLRWGGTTGVLNEGANQESERA